MMMVAEVAEAAVEGLGVVASVEGEGEVVGDLGTGLVVDLER